MWHALRVLFDLPARWHGDKDRLTVAALETVLFGYRRFSLWKKDWVFNKRTKNYRDIPPFWQKKRAQYFLKQRSTLLYKAEPIEKDLLGSSVYFL